MTYGKSMVQEPPQRTFRRIVTMPARECPECMQLFIPRHPSQLFCSAAHRDAWNNRAAVRGRVLTPLAIVARVTRDGSRGDTETGKQAASHRNHLIQNWIDEDRAAGRMLWPDYLLRRYAIGFDPIR